MKTVKQCVAVVLITALMALPAVSCKKSSAGKPESDLDYKMELKTDLPVGSSITLGFQAATADLDNIWVDLNKNQQKDAGEEIEVEVGMRFTVDASKTFIIYGKVTTMDCNNNSLTQLNVSGNKALKILHCGNNKLTSLDLSGCPELGELHCWVNQLTALNFSVNKNLYILSCYENQLKEAALTSMLNSLPAKTADAPVYWYNTQAAVTDGNSWPSTANKTAANAKKWRLFKHENYTWDYIH